MACFIAARAVPSCRRVDRGLVMGGRVGIMRRAAAALVTSVLLILLWLAREVRPRLPELPRSLSAPLSHDEIGAALALLAWAVFIVLDVAVLARVLEAGARRRPTRSELQLKRALQRRRDPIAPRTPPDWRAFAHSLEPPTF